MLTGWQFLRSEKGLAILLLIMILVLVYAPATGFPFVNFDDNEYVTDVPQVQQGLTWDEILTRTWRRVGCDSFLRVLESRIRWSFQTSKACPDDPPGRLFRGFAGTNFHPCPSVSIRVRCPPVRFPCQWYSDRNGHDRLTRMDTDNQRPSAYPSDMARNFRNCG